VTDPRERCGGAAASQEHARHVLWLTLLVTLATACSASSGQTHQGGCGGGLTATAQGQKALVLHTCAGNVGVTGGQPALTVGAGTRLTLSGLGSAFTNAESDAPTVVTVAALSSGTARLRAVSPGTATISVTTTWCIAAPTHSGCPVLLITVQKS
jgi:hypothetical protein